MTRFLLVPLFVLSFALALAASPGRPPDTRTLSPYFFVQSDDPSTDRLPLKSTSAAVDIVGVIARVKVTQVYRNDGQHALEAIYVFPGSTRAAVHGMTMTIGERMIGRGSKSGRRPGGSTRRRAIRPDRVAPRAAAAERLPDERREHPARRRDQGGAVLHRSCSCPNGASLRVRLPDGGRTPVLHHRRRDGAAVRALGAEPLPAPGRAAVLGVRLQGAHRGRHAAACTSRRRRTRSRWSMPRPTRHDHADRRRSSQRRSWSFAPHFTHRRRQRRSWSFAPHRRGRQPRRRPALSARR